MLPLFKIREFLKLHQKRLHYGDGLQPIAQIAERAGVHRDTVYACLNGDRINERTQYALSKALEEIEVENTEKSKTKIMNVSISTKGVNLNFGIGRKLFN
jgi:hypothetical protein